MYWTAHRQVIKFFSLLVLKSIKSDPFLLVSCKAKIVTIDGLVAELLRETCEKPFFPFVGEKCCNTTILDPQQLKTVDVGLTFQPFDGATFTSFVGPTIFVSQQMKTVGVGGNYAPFVVALLTYRVKYGQLL